MEQVPQSYLNGLNEILSRYQFGLTTSIDDLKLMKGGEIVVEAGAFIGNAPLAKHLWNHVSEAIHDGEYFHFTTEKAVRSILAEPRSLWLMSIIKRIGEGEISSFLEEFGFDYPLDTDPNTGQERFRASIGPTIFYSSFTDISLSDNEEQLFWEDFGDNGKGARLRFRISSRGDILRRMKYGDDVTHWSSMVKDIRDFTRNELSAEFLWQGSTMFSSLYLDAFDHERETRLIINKDIMGWHLPVCSDGHYQYLEIKFGENPEIGVSLELLEVKSNLDLHVPDGVILSRM